MVRLYRLLIISWSGLVEIPRDGIISFSSSCYIPPVSQPISLPVHATATTPTPVSPQAKYTQTLPTLNA